MPKAILEFNLPEETEEHFLALNGVKYSLVLEELDNWLRKKTKYENQDSVSVQEVRAKITELMQENGIA